MVSLIDQIARQEAEAYTKQFNGLADLLPVIEEISSVYDSLRGTVEGSGSRGQDGVIVALGFVVSCQQRFWAAVLALLRGSRSDSFTATRSAIESAAFGRRVLLHPHLAEIWLTAGESRESYDAYRAKFSAKSLFPKEVPLLLELYDAYDLCSKFSHPSVFSLAGRVKPSLDLSKGLVHLRHSDVDENDSMQPMIVVVWTARAHLKALRVLGEAFAVAGIELSSWRQHLSASEIRVTDLLEPRRDEIFTSFRDKLLKLYEGQFD